MPFSLAPGAAEPACPRRDTPPGIVASAEKRGGGAAATSLRQENPAAFERGFAGPERRLCDKTGAKPYRCHIPLPTVPHLSPPCTQAERPPFPELAHRGGHSKVHRGLCNKVWTQTFSFGCSGISLKILLLIKMDSSDSIAGNIASSRKTRKTNAFGQIPK